MTSLSGTVQRRSRLWAALTLLLAAGIATAAVVVTRPVVAQASPVDAAGTWTSHPGQKGIKKGGWKLKATVDGTQLSGRIRLTGPVGFHGGNIFGDLSPKGEVRFGVVYDSVEQATFTGVVDGPQISGTYGTRTGESGTWTGQLMLNKPKALQPRSLSRP